MSGFNKQINEFKSEMAKLKQFILSFKERVENIRMPNFTSNFDELIELCTALDSCSELFNATHVETNQFGIPDDLLTPQFASDDPILSLYEGLEYLKKIYEFLIEFKEKVENIPEVIPRNIKQKIQTPVSKQKVKPSRLPSEILRVDKTAIGAYEEPPELIIEHPEPPVIVKRKRSIDKNLVGDEYVPFNVAVPDEHTKNGSTLLNLPTTPLNVSVMPQIETCTNQIISNEIEIDKGNKVSNKQTPKSAEYELPSSVPEISIRRHNEPALPFSTIDLHSIEKEPEVTNVEIPELEPVNIDQNGLQIMQELSQQPPINMKRMTRRSSSMSSNITVTKEITSCVPIHLKKVKTRKLRDQLVYLPRDIGEFRLQPHYFDFKFNVHTQDVIDMIVELRSTLRSRSSPIITPSQVQRNIFDDHEIQKELQLTGSQSEVPRLQTNQSKLDLSSDIPDIVLLPDQQRDIQISAKESAEQSSIMVAPQSLQISHLLVSNSIVDPITEKEKIPDASYTHFENLLQEQNENRRATPKRTEGEATDVRKPLTQVSEVEMIRNMDRDQYVTLCILREIQLKYSNTNEITIKSIQSHFGNDRIGYCKLIRTSIDLQCHNLIRIQKQNNEISGIMIYDK